jgi:2,4-dienoyl-CoA reductase-like NADH-dependent reductase (Old Yellow Enzyme family)/thioredoxin reductase
MAPMVTQFTNADGTVSDRMIEYYARRARGGAGLVIVEMAAVEKHGISFPNQLRIDGEKYWVGLRTLARRIKAEGARAALQIQHAGRQSSTRILGRKPVAPSPITCPSIGEEPRELSPKEIQVLVNRFAEAASNAKELGYDAVEVHGAHGYLVCQFLSPRTNLRKDKYGGDVRRRSLFATEIIQAIRQRVGPEFPIIFRFSAEEHVKGGLIIDEALEIARLVEQAGADMLHISAGCYEAFEWVVQPMSMPRGCLVESATRVKQEVKIPVIAVGRINNVSLAEAILEEQKADLIAMGRPLIADPDLPQKALEGRERELRKCLACNECVAEVFFRAHPLICSVNAEVGKEEEWDKRVAVEKKKKRVLVIGGGPGGMEAARVAAMRGHHVHLWEKEKQLGGKLIFASSIPGRGELRNLVEYQVGALKKLGVHVFLKKEATLDFLREFQPEAVIFAVGAFPKLPDIPGIDSECVSSAEEVLQGRRSVQKSVIILGGGNTGCECAHFLLEKKVEKILVISQGNKLARSIEPLTRGLMLQNLRERGVSFLMNTEALKIENGQVLIREKDDGLRWIPADQVIIARGYTTDSGWRERLKGMNFQIFFVGDCVEPRKIRQAVQEGATVGLQI